MLSMQLVKCLTSLKKVKLKVALPYMGLVRLMPAGATVVVGAEECLHLPGAS